MGNYHDIFAYPQEELRRKTPTELDALFRDQVRRTQRGETIDQSTQRRQLIMPQDLDFPGELRPATPMTMQPKNSVPSLKQELHGPRLPFVDKQGEASTQRSRGYKPQSEYVEGKEEMTPDIKGPFSGMLSPDLEILRDSPTTERIKQFQMLHGADHVPKEFDESLDDPNDSGDELTVKRRGRSSSF